ncbi:hypothetical protein CPSG_02337 [Coccidioides posadasii str. Silveira]|uniref:Uncharacterized protein n=1 Tax=Coccidioides posadasii (strain RMSCC 757 / Silveira) TaxID=443226 RepID=E9CZ50_COCPS|nr:hypothetical protein CPSG_02337 [Coccidioides posadasii str. Silveira]
MRSLVHANPCHVWETYTVDSSCVARCIVMAPNVCGRNVNELTIHILKMEHLNGGADCNASCEKAKILLNGSSLARYASRSCDHQDSCQLLMMMYETSLPVEEATSSRSGSIREAP